ncbi:recombinase family protein [Methanomassiliicoccus luminyensis]|uniref:recombinase family protein n=1 Tax=Methanomassiliicoccus luminyensis TaxID=1080712 RepID=UPI000378805D|nr:recombinase family protein [Methanomassiliicoccus luminyensis]
MKVALYARVSTEDQDTDVQKFRLEEYAKLQGWEIFDYFKDEASGADDSRPGLDTMLEAAGITKDGRSSKPKYNAIVVTKLDRIMRSLVSLELLISKLDKQKVSLIVMDQGIDTGADGNDDTKRLIRRILGAVAEWERGMIRIRVKEGMQKAKKHGTRSGEPIGRPRAHIPPEALAAVRSGRSLRDVAAEYHISLATLQRRSKREAPVPL